MKIEYKVGDLSFDAENVDELEKSVKEFLQRRGIDFKIGRDGDSVWVNYRDFNDINANEDEQVVLNFCKARRFGKAKKVAKEFLEKKPYSSEGYRILAQILMEDGETDVAIEQADTAIRFNPSNVYALILKGNLLSRNKDDHLAGAKYYKRAMELDPSSPLVLTNYAACLMEAKADPDEQERMFRKAVDLAPDYLNAYYGLVSILAERERYDEAFEFCQAGLVKGMVRPENTQPIRQILGQMLLRLAGVLMEKFSVKAPFDKLLDEIAKAGGGEIRIEKDESLTVPAKVEIAKKYGREYDRVVFRPAKYDNPYAVLHELEKHLMRVEARRVGRECNMASLPSSEALFKEKTTPYVTERLRKMIGGIGIDDLLRNLMSGMCGQLMNCPLDLFVEKRLFEKYPDQRPAQVVGVYENIVGALNSVTAGEKGEFPKNVVRVNRILNAVQFMQYRELLGIDFLEQIHLSGEDKKTASRLYGEFCKVEESFSAGDEWSLVRRFVEELKCSSYCTVLCAENSVSVEDDAVEREHQESSREFQKRVSSGGDPALNMAITMHMVSAICELRIKSVDEVRKIAFEIAMLGCSGISPDKKSGYSVPSLGGRDMSGPQMLAYYYVSWKIAIPERADGLGLPFGKEYANAKALADLQK